MAFKLRLESVSLANNLENLEEDKKAAADAGPTSLEQFEESSLTKDILTKEDGEATPSETPSPDESPGEGSSDEPPPDEPPSDDSGDEEENSDEPPEEEPEEEPEEDPEEDDSKDEEDKDEGEPEIKTESIRRLEPIPPDFQLRMESNLFDSLSAVGLKAWAGFSFVVTVLGTVGINYGPMVLATMFKVVLFTFARTFQLLTTVGSVCAQRIERYRTSYTKLKARTNANAEAIKILMSNQAKLPKDLPEFSFDSFLLGGSGSNDLSVVLKAQADFTTRSFGTLLNSIRHEFGQLHEISSNRYLGKNFDAMAYLNDEGNFSNFSLVSGVGTPPPTGTTYRTIGRMPAGGFSCVANLPNPSDNWNQIEKNYNASGFCLIGSGSHLDLKPIGLMELAKVVVAIDYLVESNKKHQLFYEELEKARTGVITSVRSLFVQLVRSQTRISFKDSVALPLFLKSSIATKVYLVAAMDIQDHNAKVAATALAYVEQVRKLYR